MRDLRNVGGTEGGLGLFLAGLAMFVAGIYLLLQLVSVHGGYWGWGSGRGGSFGLTLVPLIVGVGVLFFDGASKLGWLLSSGGLLVIVAGVIMNLQLHVRRTSLWDMLVIVVLIAGGLGTIARSVRAAGQGGRPAGDGAPPEAP